MPKIRLFQAAATLVIALASAACTPPKGQLAAANPQKPAEARKAAPGFTLKDVDGKTIKLSDYKGKVVLLNFWATWCGPCKIEIPWFMDFQKTYKDKGFTVIGVALDDEGWEVVKPYITAKQVNYPVVTADAQTEQAYGGVDALPTTFVIDKDGKIANVHVGLVSKKEYESDIEQLLR